MAALDQVDCEPTEYVFSVILIPGLKFSALWLQDEQHDWVMPFEPNLTALENLQMHDISRVTEVLNQMINESCLSDQLGG